MSLNNGKQVDRFGTAVQNGDSVEKLGQERNSGPQAVDEASLLRSGTMQRSKDASSTVQANDREVGRDGLGRFAIGNPGGPGNPFARRVGELRRAMLAAVKPEDVADIINALVAKAKEGHVQAAKLVLSYVLGKPQPVADPDRADVDEWDLNEETAAMSKGMAEVVKAPPASVPLQTARVLRPLMGSIMKEQMADMLFHPENHFPEMPELEMAPDKKGRSTNGVFEGVGRGGPTVNGVLEGVGKGGPATNGFLPSPVASGRAPVGDDQGNSAGMRPTWLKAASGPTSSIPPAKGFVL